MSFDIDIAIHRGGKRIAARIESASRVVALFGPSGAGKTSILQMIAGLLPPESGHIVISGEVLFDSTAGIDVPPEKRACGYVFQDGRLFPHRRVRENLLYGWKLAPPERRWMALDVAVGFLGIAHLLDRMPGTLSGGEAQRVAIGRALLSGPRFLLMDEPLSSLDAARRHEIMLLIERIRDEMEIPILYVSHDRSEVERLAGTVIDVG
ncbi:MAG: ATP-binding cassette domain-containing protein [Novosphingobium sp.]|nr:ATP-binding cassette domain-containing protein [Novosphingobium sp.]